MRALHFLKMILMFAIALVVFGFVTKELWNWLMPSIFGLRSIRISEAIGLVLLGKILFGGIHKHGHGRPNWNRRREWKQKMKARWNEMSEEERARFRSGMRGRWNCGGFEYDNKWGAEQAVEEGAGPVAGEGVR
jgi:hypothetical protein